MGWKNVKDHYCIKHPVQVTSEGICIGSPYIHNIIVLDTDGQIVKAYDRGGNEDLDRYQREMEADPVQLRQLIQAPDTFSNSITVYTYDGGEIIEKQCETLGWPNVTHDGAMMYENTFSEDRNVVVQWALANAKQYVKHTQEQIERIEAQLKEARGDLAKYEADVVKLGNMEPHKAVASDAN